MATRTSAQTRRAHVRLSRVRTLPDQDAGVAVPLAAWSDARADLDLVELVAAGDALVRRGRCSLTELVSVAEGSSGRGCRLPRRAGSLVRERVDSLPESRLRMAVVLAAGPAPTFDAEWAALFERRA